MHTHLELIHYSSKLKDEWCVITVIQTILGKLYITSFLRTRRFILRSITLRSILHNISPTLSDDGLEERGSVKGRIGN